MSNIKERIKQLTMVGLPLMEGKEQLKVEGAILGHVLTVDDYGFLNGEDGEYVVISLQEYPKNFIYGSSVITDAFKRLESDIPHDELVQALEEGLTFKIDKVQSRSTNRIYNKITFYPEI